MNADHRSILLVLKRIATQENLILPFPKLWKKLVKVPDMGAAFPGDHSKETSDLKDPTAHLMIEMAWADGKLHPSEISFFSDYLSKRGFSKSNRERLLQLLEKKPEVETQESGSCDPLTSFSLLYESLRMMVADKLIHAKELEFFEEKARRLDAEEFGQKLVELWLSVFDSMSPPPNKFLDQTATWNHETIRQIDHCANFLNKCTNLAVSALGESTKELDRLKLEFDQRLLELRQNGGFRIVVFGLGKAGKSTLANAILGIEDCFEVHANPCTDCVQEQEWEGLLLTDTPGLDANDRPEDEAQAWDAIAKTDLLLFAKNIEAGEFDAPSILFLRRLAERKIPLIVVHTMAENVEEPNIKKIIGRDISILKDECSFYEESMHYSVRAKWFFKGPRRDPSQSDYFRNEYSGIHQLREEILVELEKNGMNMRRNRILRVAEEFKEKLVILLQKELEHRDRKIKSIADQSQQLASSVKKALDDLEDVSKRADQFRKSLKDVFKRWDKNTSGFFSYVDYMITRKKKIRAEFQTSYLTYSRVKDRYSTFTQQALHVLNKLVVNLQNISGEESDKKYFSPLKEKYNRLNSNMVQLLNKNLKSSFTRYLEKDLIDCSSLDEGKAASELGNRFRDKIHVNFKLFCLKKCSEFLGEAKQLTTKLGKMKSNALRIDQVRETIEFIKMEDFELCK